MQFKRRDAKALAVLDGDKFDERGERDRRHTTLSRKVLEKKIKEEEEEERVENVKGRLFDC
jgi:hypothetical protein